MFPQFGVLFGLELMCFVRWSWHFVVSTGSYQTSEDSLLCRV